MKTVSFENVKSFGEKENAIQVEINGEDYWVPKAQISPTSSVREAPEEGTLIVNLFWAKKVGLVKPEPLKAV